MGKLIRNDDLKRIFTGAGLAVVAGLAMGASIQPSLTDGILAPQQEWAGGGVRDYASAPTRDVGAYPGQVPDYVIGTNYTRPQAPPDEEQFLAYEERAQPAAYDAGDYGETAEAHAPQIWTEEPREEAYYPSMRGGAYNPSDLPEAPEPPVDVFDPA